MRKSLNATTALVAGLHLAVPAPLLAQSADGEPAVGSEVAQQVMEICAEMNVEACAEATGLSTDIVEAAMDTDPAETSAEPVTEDETADELLGETPDGMDPVVDAPEVDASGELGNEGEEPLDDGVSEPAENADEAMDSATDRATPPPDAVEDGAEETMDDAGEVLEDSLEDSGPEAPTDPDMETGNTSQGNVGPDEVELDAEPATGTDSMEPSDMTDETPDMGADALDADEFATNDAPAALADDEDVNESFTDTDAAGGDVSESEAGNISSDDMPETGGETDTTNAAEDTVPSDTSGMERPEEDAATENQMTDTEREARQGSSNAGVAATAEDAEPSSEVLTESVTEESSRSSGEDFELAISRDVAADANTESVGSDDDDDGLSTLQKALLAGAGIVAVGTLLNNNREVVASSGDRVVVSGRDGGYELIKDDTAILQRPGTEVSTESFDDGSTRTTVLRPDGSQVVTIRDAELRVLQRVRVTPEGERIVLIDDTEETQAVDVSSLRPAARQSNEMSMDSDTLRQALTAQGAFDRSFSLSQVRNIAEVREQVPAVNLDNVTFASGSAAITPQEADALATLGSYIRDTIAENPREIFLVEGHTDAVGDAAYNLALSDRRAELVALALAEYFDVPPENLVVQGYGERFLAVQTEEAERANRRATLRRITPLLRMAAAN